VATTTQKDVRVLAAPRPTPARRSRGARDRSGRVMLYVVLTILGVIAALPFVWMILSSFKPEAEVRAIPPTFWPQEGTLDNYRKILNDPELPLALIYRNSAFVAVMHVISTLFTGSLLGYIFAKFDFRFRAPLFWFILATMMIPPQVTMLPGYLILLQMNLLNNLWGLIVPSFIDAFAVFVMRQFILSIPNDEIWSARVDGATEWRIYRSIVLPQLRAPLATLGMLTFMFSWNAYLWPLIVLTDLNKRTLPIILTWYSNHHSAQNNLIMAASVLMVIPVLIIFALSQKWIVRGLTLTGGR
jgi:multiple sugar transport system permease protein